MSSGTGSTTRSCIVFDWTLPDGAESDPQAEACRGRHLEPVDEAWQLQRQKDLALLWELRRRDIVDCLVQKWIDVDTNLEYPDVVRLATTVDHLECVHSVPWKPISGE